MKQGIISVYIMDGTLNFNFNEHTIPGILFIVYILNFILFVPSFKV